MSLSDFRTGSLVLYKIHPALVAQVSDKIEITLPGGKSKRVRDKDVTLLHPGPLRSLDDLQADSPNIEEAWELVQGESTALPELAELLYGDFTPASAWATWELLSDGLYFEGSPKAIRARKPEQVEAERSARDEKLAEEQAWDIFLQRIRAGQLEDEDRKRLSEVERLALNQIAASKILSALDVAETPESAHRFLVKCGYWPAEFNPWPQRSGAIMESAKQKVPDFPDEDRLDLTHLIAYAIDDEGNTDPDDAISLDGDYLWVHVADVAALVRPNGHLDQAARERGANLYLPEGVINMLPEEVTERLGLGLHDESPALSFGFRLTDDGLADIRITPTRVRVIRLSYDEVDDRLDEPEFDAIRQITDTYHARRLANDAAQIDLPEVSTRVVDGEPVIRPLPCLQSRQMVTDAMLMAGEAAARFAQANEVAIPYATQPQPDEIRHPQLMSEMYAYRRLFKPSRAALQPDRHFGLGLEMYARATSPLRRYPDLVVHQQLRAFVTGGEPASVEQITERIGAAEAVSGVVRRSERLSNLHWKLVYLSHHPDWQGEAVIVELQERKAVAIIPELALDTKIRLQEGMQLDQRIQLAVREVDLPAQAVYFRML